MGFNIAGVLTNLEIKNEIELNKLLEKRVKHNKEVSGEEATLSKFNDEYDIYSTEKGSIIFFQLGKLFEFSNLKGEFIQFMVSDVSDTYYFEKIKDGVIERKLIISQGEIAENEGEGYINKEDDFEDVVFQMSSDLLGIESIFEVKFDRYF